MNVKKATPEEAIRMLREIEVLNGQGSTIDEACRKVGIYKQTFYKWRKEYGKMNLDKAKKLKHLERENARLKKLVAELSLDNAILKEAAEGNF